MFAPISFAVCVYLKPFLFCLSLLLSVCLSMVLAIPSHDPAHMGKEISDSPSAVTVEVLSVCGPQIQMS